MPPHATADSPHWHCPSSCPCTAASLCVSHCVITAHPFVAAVISEYWYVNAVIIVVDIVKPVPPIESPAGGTGDRWPPAALPVSH